jgi:hypothetical protein
MDWYLHLPFPQRPGSQVENPGPRRSLRHLLQAFNLWPVPADPQILGKSQQCSHKATWRRNETLPKALPEPLRPAMLLRIIFWFSQRSTIEAMTSRCDASSYSVSHSVNELRDILRIKMSRECDHSKLGNRTNTAVLIDETYITRKKRNKGGFIGHQSQGNQTKILAGIEIDLTTRICTGLTFMVVIPNCTRSVIQAEILLHVAVGALMDG